MAYKKYEKKLLSAIRFGLKFLLFFIIKLYYFPIDFAHIELVGTTYPSLLSTYVTYTKISHRKFMKRAHN